MCLSGEPYSQDFDRWSSKSNVPKKLYSKCNRAKSTTLGLLAGSKMVLEPRLCSAKKWSCQVVGSHHSCQAIYACVGEGLASHHAVIALKLLVLGTAIRKVATIEVARARCPSFSSKLCSQFGPFQHGSLQERRLCKNRSHQQAGSKMVLSRDPTRIISFSQLVSSCHRLQHLQLLLDRVRDCAGKKVKLRSCSYPPVFPRRSRFVLGRLCFSAWVTHKIWYMVKGHSLCVLPWRYLGQTFPRVSF